MKIYKPLFLLIAMSFCAILFAQADYDAVEGASTIEVYKTVNETELKLWFFNPENIEVDDKKPAIIFFFGGGWAQGSPNQFLKHSEYLAARGMIAILADYRVSKRHGNKAEKCVADAKSSIRYLRKHAVRLGIDPEKIISAGGSAGGHLGASVAILPGLDDPADDMTISSIPNASVLFNPVLATAEILGKFELNQGFSATLESKIGIPLKAMSPYHHVKFGVGPMLIFHGTEDKTVPFITAKSFHEKTRAAGNQSTLVAYEGEDHGFFNYKRLSNGPYIDTVKRMDDFLVLHGYLEPIPLIKVY